MYYYGGYGGYGHSDILYIALLIAFAFSLYASWRVKSVYRKYQDDGNLRGITGARTARRINPGNFRHIPDGLL